MGVTFSILIVILLSIYWFINQNIFFFFGEVKSIAIDALEKPMTVPAKGTDGVLNVTLSFFYKLYQQELFYRFSLLKGFRIKKLITIYKRGVGDEPPLDPIQKFLDSINKSWYDKASKNHFTGHSKKYLSRMENDMIDKRTNTPTMTF